MEEPQSVHVTCASALIPLGLHCGSGPSTASGMFMVDIRLVSEGWYGVGVEGGFGIVASTSTFHLTVAGVEISIVEGVAFRFLCVAGGAGGGMDGGGMPGFAISRNFCHL